ncbi:ATP-binding protein [Streptomyces sp. NPDC002588]|uniref:ATP-binding protein n=1 Tax=Streptomyces sp. NPDC002588 TaxID=3154419 RepID=UPI00331FB841
MAMLRLTGGGPRPDSAARHAGPPRPPTGAGLAITEYDPRPAAVREARAQVRGRLADWGLADRGELVDTAELLVSELATNAVLLSTSRFRLTLTLAHGLLRCEVLGADGAAGGGGMFLVEALARRWGRHRDRSGTTMWFELATE